MNGLKPEIVHSNGAKQENWAKKVCVFNICILWNIVRNFSNSLSMEWRNEIFSVMKYDRKLHCCGQTVPVTAFTFFSLFISLFFCGNDGLRNWKYQTVFMQINCSKWTFSNCNFVGQWRCRSNEITCFHHRCGKHPIWYRWWNVWKNNWSKTFSVTMLHFVLLFVGFICYLSHCHTSSHRNTYV